MGPELEEVEPEEQEEQGSAPLPVVAPEPPPGYVQKGANAPPPGYTAVRKAASAVPDPPPGFHAVTLAGEATPRPVPPEATGAPVAAKPAPSGPSVSELAYHRLAGILREQYGQEGYAPDDLRMMGPSQVKPTEPPAVMEPPSPLSIQGQMTRPLPKLSFAAGAAFLNNPEGSQQMAVARGLDRFAQSLLTPENMAILGGTAVAALIVGPIAPLVVGGYYTVKMLAGLFEQFPDLEAAAMHAGETGDNGPFIEKATELGLTGITAALAAAHTATGGTALGKRVAAEAPAVLLGDSVLGRVARAGEGLKEAAGQGLSEGLAVPKGVVPPVEPTVEDFHRLDIEMARNPAPGPPVAEKPQPEAPPPISPVEAEAAEARKEIYEGAGYTTVPPPQALADLLVKIGQRGDVSHEDVPELLDERIRVENSLIGLQEILGPMKGQVGRYRTVLPDGTEEWIGVKSPLPDVLQKYKYKYEDIQAIIDKAVAGEKLTAKQQRFFDDAYRYYASKPRTPLSPDTIVSYLERHNSGSAALELMFRDKQAAEGGQVEPDHLADLTEFFGAEAAAERAALGSPVPLSGVTGESHTMPNGDQVEKLAPPDTFFREAIRKLLNDPKTEEDFQAAADWTLRPRYGIEQPVEVRLEDVPLSRIEEVGNGFRITLPLKAEPYELLHEFAELRKKLGDPMGEPLHDNNVIADKYVREAVKDEGSATPRWAEEALSDKSGIGESIKDYIALSDDSPLGSASMAGGAALGFYGKKAVESAKPALESFYNDSKDFAMRLVHLVAPGTGTPIPILNAVVEKIGATNRMVDSVILRAQQQKWLSRIARMSNQELIQVIDEMKTPGPLSDPVLRPMKDFFAAVNQQLFNEQLKLAPNTNFIQDHFRLMFTRESLDKLQSTNAEKYRSLTGTEGWRKHQFFETLSDAIAAGLEPRSYNPIQLFLWDIMDRRKFVDAHNLWQQAVASGNAVAVPRGTPSPLDGWRKMDFDSRVLRAYLSDESLQKALPGVPGAPEPRTTAGSDWYLEPNFYRVLANHLSRDFIRETPMFDRILRATMIDKAITLAVPMWHGTLETIGAAGAELLSDAWRVQYEGVKALKGGDVDGAALLKSVGRLLSSPLAPWRIAREGGKVRQLVANPEEFIAANKEWLDAHPGFQEEVEAAYNAGAGFRIPADFRQGYFGAIRSAIQDSNPTLAAFRAVVRLVPDASEFIAGPMFNNYIPRLHWGVYLKEIADAKLQYGDDIMSGKMDIQDLRRRVWNSVYDRFGRVNYDNWFWNRTFKSALQMVLLSPAWLGGDIRLAVTAGARQASEIGNLIDMAPDPNNPGAFKAQFGRAPKLAPEMKALLSVLVPGAIISSVFQTAMSGQPPWSTDTPLEDLVWPRTGKVDADGHPKRVAFPGYGPAYWSMVHDPLHHLANAASPLLKRTLEAMPWNNRKFYTGEFVYNPEDSRFKQALDAIRHAAFGNWPVIGEGPFFQQNLSRMATDQAPAGEKAVGFLGVRPAPSYLDKTDFEESIDRMRNRFLPVGRLKGDIDRAQALKGARDAVREGADASVIYDQIKAGDFSIRQREAIAKARGMTPYQAAFAGLGLRDALVAWRHISDAERQKYLPILRGKIVNMKTGEPKSHVWDGIPQSEIPVVREELQRALSGR